MNISFNNFVVLVKYRLDLFLLHSLSILICLFIFTKSVLFTPLPLFIFSSIVLN